METCKLYSSILLLTILVYALCWNTANRLSVFGVYPPRYIEGKLSGDESAVALKPGSLNSSIGFIAGRLDEVPNPNGTNSHNGSSVAMRGSLSKHILLVTYYRGGSTFLGEIFAHHPDSFYWFEPLRGLLGNLYGNLGEYKPRVKHFLNIEDQYTRKSAETVVELSNNVMLNRSRVLEAVLSCRVKSLPDWLLGDSFVKEAAHMPKMEPFSACLMFAKTPANKQRCLTLLSALCSMYPITVLKTIRYPVYALDDLLSRIPNLFAIYYVRDPRGIMSSRKDLHRFRSAHLSLFAQNLCDAMAKNHEHFVRMRSRFPNRLLMLRYEDLALSPQQIAEKLYAFMGLAIPGEVLAWIKSNTALQRQGGPFDTKRNSTQAAMSWRHTLDEREKELIYDKCRTVLDLYGYDK